MAKIKVRSVEWTARQIEVVYQNLMALGGGKNPLPKDKKKAVNRMIRDIEAHPNFKATSEEAVCPLCKNFVNHFEATGPVLLAMRRADRKVAYDEIFEAGLKGGLPKNLERTFSGIGAKLGYKNHIASLLAPTMPEDDEDAEFEEETDEEFAGDDAPDPEEKEDAGADTGPDADAGASAPDGEEGAG